MKNYFKQGQEVWHLDEQLEIFHGTVTEIRKVPLYTVFVNFGKFNGHFTSDGKMSEDGHICLFQNKPMITENVPIFEERPAYFFRCCNELWLYGTIIKINENGSAICKQNNIHYKTWQYEKPELI